MTASWTRGLGGVALAVLFAIASWQVWSALSDDAASTSAPAAQVSSLVAGATGLRLGEQAAPSLGLPAAVTAAVDPQRDGRARPGPPLDSGLTLRHHDREVGRLWPAAARGAAMVVIWAPGAAVDEVGTLAGQLRATRDYHLVALVDAAVSATEVAAVLAQAEGALGRPWAALALVAVGGPAATAIEVIMEAPGAVALALVSPRGRLDVTAPAWQRLAARHALYIGGQDDSAAAPVRALWSRLPLGRVMEAPAASSVGLDLLRERPRLRTDLAGWLFALMPASE